MEIRLAAPLQYDSIVDGEGMRIVLWTQGCPHNCIGCHNPSTHSFKDGFLTNTEDSGESYPYLLAYSAMEQFLFLTYSSTLL